MLRAAIDIGTVTCRLFVAQVQGSIERELVRECRIVNLGIGVSQTGYLREDAIDRVVECVADYCNICAAIADSEGVSSVPISAVATSASRDARNSNVLIERLAALGVDLQIIPGEIEAGLSFLGASTEFPGEHLVVVDVGGGSTEVIFGTSKTGVEFAHSFNIGCRRITEMFIKSDPPTAAELEKAREYLHGEFSLVLDEQLAIRQVDRVVAVAGTATSVVSVDLAMEAYDSARVHKTVVPDSILRKVFDRLASITEAERMQVVGLEPKRAPVIVAGMLILMCVLEVLGKDSFTVSESDILQGIILQ